MKILHYSLAKFHDHLTFKEPWYLLWCSVNDQLTFEDLRTAVMNSSVHEAFDYIENFRLDFLEMLYSQLALSYLHGQNITEFILKKTGLFWMKLQFYLRGTS